MTKAVFSKCKRQALQTAQVRQIGSDNGANQISKI